MNPLLTHRPTSVPRSTARSRTGVTGLACALAIIAAACGGGSDDTSGFDGGADASASADATGSDSGGSSGDVAVDVDENGMPSLAFDAASLPDRPVTAADLRVFDPNGGDFVRTSPVAAVVNSCDVLTDADVEGIIFELTENDISPKEMEFEAGVGLGSSCTFFSEPTHVMGVIVGTTDEVSTDTAAATLPNVFGEVTATAWTENPAISILSDDFVSETNFGAHIEAGGYGIFVYNSAGTFLDQDLEGTVFARLAEIAASNVGSAGPPAPVDETANIQTARPCDLFTAEELQAMLGNALSGDVENPQGVETQCRFGTFEGIEVNFSVDHVSTFDPTGLTQSPNSASVYSGVNRAHIVAGDSVVMISVNTPFDQDLGTNPSGIAAATALAENLAARFTG